MTTENEAVETVIDESYYHGPAPAGAWRTDGIGSLEQEDAPLEKVVDATQGVDTSDPRLQAPSRAPASEAVADNAVPTTVQDTGPDPAVVAADQAASAPEAPAKATGGGKASSKG